MIGSIHIGPIAKLVFDSYNSIACTYQAWYLLLDDSKARIYDILNELQIRKSSLINSYTAFNKSAGNLSSSSREFYKYFVAASSEIDKLRANFVKLDTTLSSLDVLTTGTINRLVNDIFTNSFDYIQDSTTQNKSCTPGVVQSQTELFMAFRNGFTQCQEKFVELDGLTSLMSLGLPIPMRTFNTLTGCVTSTTNNTKALDCLKTVNALSIFIKRLFNAHFSFPHRI